VNLFFHSIFHVLHSFRVSTCFFWHLQALIESWAGLRWKKAHHGQLHHEPTVMLSHEVSWVFPKLQGTTRNP
jgi:hypothetical protein